MKYMYCPQEAAITKAVISGSLEGSLTAHALTCATCREVVKAASWMQSLPRTSENNLSLPDPGLLWWGARLSEKQKKMEKAENILEWTESVSVAFIFLSLTGWIAWKWRAIQAPVIWFFADVRVWTTTYSMSVFLLPMLIVLCLSVLVLAYPILMDE